MYLTYEEYISYGGELSEAAFNKYSYQAEMKIKADTHNRIRAASEAVKRCAARLTDIFGIADAAAEDKVSSFSQDGVSLTFAARSSSECEKEADDIVYTYLIGEYAEDGTPLLYRGCDK